MAMRIGPRYKYSCMPLVLNGSELAYVEQIKYLGNGHYTPISEII